MHVLLAYRQDDCAPDQYYVCASNGFRGCCVSGDPCSLSGGCPDGDNSASHSARTTSASAISSSPSISATRIETITSVSGGQTVFITVTQAPASTASPTESALSTSNGSEHGQSHTGAIAGGVVGGVAAIALVAFAFFLVRRRRRASERKEATLPPSYAETDMSEHIGGTTTAAAALEAKNRESETAIDEKAGLEDNDGESVQQLDSTMVIPTTEMGSEPVGHIAELPVIEKDTSPRPEPSDAGDSSETIKPHHIGDEDNRVMSWAQFNSMGNRNSAARLSHPHPAPDTSTTVWSNLSPTKATDGEGDAEKVENDIKQEQAVRDEADEK